jgi:hypothetical protein
MLKSQLVEELTLFCHGIYKAVHHVKGFNTNAQLNNAVHALDDNVSQFQGHVALVQYVNQAPPALVAHQGTVSSIVRTCPLLQATNPV